jgi:hypothetical protein
MRIFTHNKFEGYYPVGTAAIVVADGPIEAAKLLEVALAEKGLNQKIAPDDMHETYLDRPSARVLCDGNY